jgi:type IV protein arginine methyltransferase
LDGIKSPTSRYFSQITPDFKVIHSKWQDAVEQLSEGEPFDAIYYDAYAESYRDLREFFEAVVGLLKPNGIFSFFNGLGADRYIVNDVYSVVVALDLAGFGMDVNYSTIPINLTEETWKGTKTGRYWELDRYLLPICNFVE